MKRTQQGFTLIETVIAFAIVALSLGVLYQTFGQALRREHRADAETLALLHLASVRDRAGIESRLAMGLSEGRIDDRFGWRLEVRPAATDATLSTAALSLVEVIASVSWQQDDVPHSVSVRSLELAPLDPR